MLDALQIEIELSRAAAGSETQTATFETQEYELRSSGGSRATVVVPWADGLVTDLAVLASDDPDPTVVQRLGDRLAAILAPAGWAVHEAAVRDAVACGRPVHLSFRFAAAELYALPWELLTLQGSGQHIGELAGVLLQYTWPDAQTTPGKNVGHRLLFAWSAARGARARRPPDRGRTRSPARGQPRLGPRRRRNSRVSTPAAPIGCRPSASTTRSRALSTPSPY